MASAREKIQQLGFCDPEVSKPKHDDIKVKYDSKACTCSFVLDDAVVEGGEVEQVLLHIAKSTFSHFLWFEDEIIDDGEAQ